MIPVLLSKTTVETMRRNAFYSMQKLSLELTRYSNSLPGYLQDKNYIEAVESKLNEQTEIFEQCSAALKPLEVKTEGGQS